MKTQPSDPNEEPFPLADSEDKDRLWDVLGKARSTEAAPNFVQNVVREARLSADQTSGSAVGRWFASVVEKFQRPAFAITATAAAAVVIGLVVALSQPDSDNGIASNPAPTPAPAPSPSVEAPAPRYTVSDQLDDIDYLGDLVAVTDPAALNDQMLADLLY